MICYDTLMLQISYGGGPTMDSENVLRLQKCREELVSSLEFDLMSPCLIQYNLLTTSEYDNIKLKPGNTDKVTHDDYLNLTVTKIFVFID